MTDAKGGREGVLAAAEKRGCAVLAERFGGRRRQTYIVVSPAWRGEHECIVQLCKGIEAWDCLLSSTSQGSLEQPIGATGPLSGRPAADDIPANRLAQPSLILTRAVFQEPQARETVSDAAVGGRGRESMGVALAAVTGAGRTLPTVSHCHMGDPTSRADSLSGQG